ncbi:MAPEG family protein [Alkalicaulis satelles]|uniref:MAPEG family protein n=1 Tax=Alkalicaulis satelles TaxID=2609175 RepID=A0A5M6ZDH3_9PROT|nr:MAPEG family protein [Alkalicaulis satelles]KAA5802365.1 MAPEG family protein [Alkalicaulis satelles]
MYQSILTPVLILIAWTLVMWLWMYATRIPAMKKAGLNPAKLKEKSELDVLPRSVRQIGDNHNHLHEQPVLFYALAFYIQLTGSGQDAMMIGLAWGYVALRIAHSLFQALVNFIPVRFVIYSLASILLIIMTALCVIRLL